MTKRGTPITIRGVEYPSVRSAAEAIGVAHSTLLKAISTGTQEICGLGRAMPVAVRGTVYPSAKACADALGLAASTVQKAVREGRTDHLGLGTGFHEGMTIRVRGVTYANAAECAKALGVSRTAIWSAIARGRIDRLGLGVDYANRKCPGGTPKPITIGGKRFRSIADLARFIGRPPFSVRDSLKAGDVARGRILRAVIERLAREEQMAWKAHTRAMQREQEAA